MKEARRFGLYSLCFTPRTLIQSDPSLVDVFIDQRSYVETHADFGNIPLHVENWSAQNFLLWKPALLSHLLAESFEGIEEDDILFYHDANVEKFPEYLEGVRSWRRLARKYTKRTSVVLFHDNDIRLKQDVKPDLLERTLGSSSRELRHIWAGAAIFKKNAESRAFVESWLRLSLELDNRAPVPMRKPCSDLLVHSQEQACLSVVAYSDMDGCRPPKCRTVDLFGTRRIPVTFRQRLREQTHRTLKKLTQRVDCSVYRRPRQRSRHQ